MAGDGDGGVRTQAWKTTRWPSQLTYFFPGGLADCSRHTIDSHWFRFSESPTNIRRLLRSRSSSSRASNLPLPRHPLCFSEDRIGTREEVSES